MHDRCNSMLSSEEPWCRIALFANLDGKEGNQKRKSLLVHDLTSHQIGIVI